MKREISVPTSSSDKSTIAKCCPKQSNTKKLTTVCEPQKKKSSETTMTSFCKEYSNCEWLIASRVVIVLFYVIACLATNGVVFYVYRKKSKKEAPRKHKDGLRWYKTVLNHLIPSKR